MMKRTTFISLIVTVAAMVLPGMSYAQNRDSLVVDIDFIDDDVDTGDLQLKDDPVVKEKKPRKSRKDIKLQTDTLSFDNLYLDTVVVNKKKLINDYTMIGVQYGAGVASAFYNPSRQQRFVVSPYNFGIVYTRYGKMFNFMPYFGLQVGAFYNTEGYRFKIDKETGAPNYTESGADRALITTYDGSVLAHAHIDFWKMKLIINAGYYVGYRANIVRYRNDEIISKEFNDYDRRFDYGLKGGAGFGFVFDPVEFHLTATYKHSFNCLFDPDYDSPIYYRYAYPYSIIISAGIHVQLTKRVGKTTRQIKMEAREALIDKK